MLTKRQSQIFEFIKECISERGYSPTLKELCSYFGLRSVATMHEHIEKMVSLGVLCKNDGGRVSLNVDISEDDNDKKELPLLGLIQAGIPVEEFEDDDEKVEVPSTMYGKDLYALKVKGDSMKDDHIIEGDIVIIDGKKTPRAGDIVVALIDDYEITLKRYFPEKEDMIRLQPANEAFKPIEIEGERVRIQGVLRGIIREL
ncbi:MAG: repressor LexA [Candidatus Muiribacterium halophilum]|uniref:LexA repressor n=1 Tax=Muiribacterium halophilum TaxID=2053465 RepID=A0A2N5ZE94_MUIH1|nr:MAG: repressor LexA [Candidatus Muirbacterium halophilum]